jgi:predicted porin
VVIASNGVHIGDNDNGYNNLRVQNAVKYVSPAFNDFVHGPVWFQRKSGRFQPQPRLQHGSGYKVGNFRWAVAYTQMDHPNSSGAPNGAIGNDYASSLLIFNKSTVNGAGVNRQRIAGTGGFYNVGRTEFGAMYSNVKYHYLDNTNLTLQNVDINLNHN